MYAGNSVSQGILLYDSDLNGHDGILCYYENGEPCFKPGPHKELYKELSEMDEPYTDQSSRTILLIFAAELAVMIGIIWAVAKLVGGFFAILGAVIFAVGSYFPITCFVYALQNRYTSTADHHRFKRHHAAEHMIVNYTKDKDTPLDLDALKKASRLHRECGTTYMGTLIILFGLIGAAVAMLPALGVLKAILMIILSIILLFLNILFNPLNPLKLLQLFVTEKPTDKELLLVLEGMKRLQAMAHEGNQGQET